MNHRKFSQAGCTNWFDRFQSGNFSIYLCVFLDHLNGKDIFIYAEWEMRSFDEMAIIEKLICTIPKRRGALYGCLVYGA